MNYNSVSPDMVSELKQRIGEKAVYTDPDKRVAFASDESKLTYLPELVVEPTSTGQIQELMHWATKHRIPVTPHRPHPPRPRLAPGPGADGFPARPAGRPGG